MTTTPTPPTTAAAPGAPELVVTAITHRAYSESDLILEALRKKNVKLRERDTYALPLTRDEVLVLLEGVADVRPFLNPRSTEYRDRRMGEKPPSADLAAELIAREPRLLRVPILLKGDEALPVVIETDAAVLSPEVWKFVGVEVKEKKVPPGGKAAAAAKAAAAPAPAPKDAKPG